VAKPEEATGQTPASSGPVIIRSSEPLATERPTTVPDDLGPPPTQQPTGPESLIERLAELIRDARSMPLSSSALVNRQEVLELVDQLRGSLPSEITRARSILRDGQEVLERAGQEAQRVLERARQERERLLSKTEIVQAAAREADRLVAEAESTAKRIRAEAETYVEGKLANFEVVLQKTLQAVERGRKRLAGSLEADELAPEDTEETKPEK
jgi:cell division septum initiation protein DivIVA